MNYTVSRISKTQAAQILLEFHYLKDISKGFKSGYNWGLFDGELLIGAVIYTGFPVPELVKGMFNLPRTEQQGMFELSRLCILPSYQGEVKNIASYFVSKSLKLLRNETTVRCVLSYADSSFHVGTVYQACNFKYYGLSESKKDFWINTPEGQVKHSRGPTKGIDGEWKPRSRKHRYVLIYDKSLSIAWDLRPYPKRDSVN